MKNYNELRSIDVNKFVETKNGMKYLSWSYAVDTLLLKDPSATWEFLPHLEINGTILVRCQVHAFEKTMFMQLAVFDFKNKAILNPSATDVSNSMMRCLVKAIACFGIGLYLYAGEDLPPEDSSKNSHAPSNMQPTDEEAGAGFSAAAGHYIIPFSTHKGRSIFSTFEIVGKEKLENMIKLCEERINSNNPYAGATIEQIQTFVNEATDFIIKFENQDIY